MIRKQFFLCAVSTDKDIKATGVELDVVDVPSERFNLEGRVISDLFVPPESRLFLHINGQIFETIITECGRMYGNYITHFKLVE